MYPIELSKISLVKNIIENGMIPKLNDNNGPPKSVESLGQWSKLLKTVWYPSSITITANQSVESLDVYKFYFTLMFHYTTLTKWEWKTIESFIKG